MPTSNNTDFPPPTDQELPAPPQSVSYETYQQAVAKAANADAVIQQLQLDLHHAIHNANMERNERRAWMRVIKEQVTPLKKVVDDLINVLWSNGGFPTISSISSARDALASIQHSLDSLLRELGGGDPLAPIRTHPRFAALRARARDGTLTEDAIQTELEGMGEGFAELVYANPERMRDFIALLTQNGGQRGRTRKTRRRRGGRRKIHRKRTRT